MTNVYLHHQISRKDKEIQYKFDKYYTRVHKKFVNTHKLMYLPLSG